MVACEGIAGGDLKRPVPAVGVGEIRRLANAFDTVRDRLAAALSEVVSWNAVLEERVQEKTEDLSLSVNELQASRDYLQAVVDSLTDEMQIVARDGTILQVNTARLEATGRQRDKVVGTWCCSAVCGGRVSARVMKENVWFPKSGRQGGRAGAPAGSADCPIRAGSLRSRRLRSAMPTAA